MSMQTGNSSTHVIQFDTTSNTSSVDSWNFAPEGQVIPRSTTSFSGPNNCNESDIHSGSEKMLWHSMKGAFRALGLHTDMSDDFETQPEQAARIAASAGIAYLQSEGMEYDREDSFDYLEDNIIKDSLLDRLREVFKSGTEGGDHLRATETDLVEGIEQAWNQTDSKSHHDDGARTAIAIAEAFLAEKIW